MTNTTRLLVTASAFAIAALGAVPAFAAGTTAGSNITNTATVNYQVGGVAQTPINASNTFVVDRKISMTLTGGAATTSVVPGQNNAVTTYQLTNTSNATLDFGLALAQQAGGTAAHGGADNFDTTAATFYVNTGASANSATFDPANSKQVTYVDELGADASQYVFVLSNVPAGQKNGDVSGQYLTATAEEGGVANTQGAVVTQTAGANTAGVDTVFADAAGVTDAARDGKISAAGDYTVSAPVLSVVKTSTIVSDPLNGTTNPKNIPGAVVGYCITVTNAAGGAAANNVAVSDPLPAQTTYDSTYGVFTNGTATCTSDAGTTKTTPAAGTTIVSGTIPTVAAGSTRSVYFQVTIN